MDVLNRTGRADALFHGRAPQRSSGAAEPPHVAGPHLAEHLEHSPNTSPNTRRTPRRTLAEHIAEHSPNPSPNTRRTHRRPRARLYVAGTPAPKRAAVLPRRRPGCTHAALGPSPGGRRCGGARTQSRLLPGVPQRRIVSVERPGRKSPVNCARRAVRIVKERAAEEHGACTRRESVRARSELRPNGCANHTSLVDSS